jgi:hypothetical protein
LDIADIAVAVLLKLGVEGERIDLLGAGNILGEINHEVG